MGSVFISYSSKDRDRVAVIADTLRTMGLEVWWDREIPVATTYHEHIKKQLDEAQAVVVVWSAASVASQYVLWEAQRAHRRGILVPVVIEEADLPPDFFLIQAADLTRWRGNPADAEWKRLTGALARLVTDDVAASPVPTVSSAAAADPAKAPTRAARVKPAPRPPASAPATSRPWYARRAGVAALGGAGLIAVVVALILMSGGGTDSTTTLAGATTAVATTTTTSSTTAAPITTTTLPPTTAAPPPVPDLVWSRIWSEGSGLGGAGTQKMLGLVEWDSGLVAVGEDTTSSGEGGGAVWISADGSVWDKVAGNADISGGVMYGIAAGGPGLVAVGSLTEQEAAGVWTSTDGTTWEQVAYEPAVFGGAGTRMLAVASTDPGFVAVGDDGGFGAAWTSLDGITWERVDHDFGRGIVMSVLAVGPSEIVAAGTTFSPQGEWDAVVWTSDDGLSWERLDSETFGDSDRYQWINAVTVGGPGLVAVGGEGNPADGDIDAAVWTSSDGHQWMRVADVGEFGGEGLQEMFGVAAGDLGLIAVGSDTSAGDWDAAVWTSSNGTTWEQVIVPTSPDDAGAFDAGQMRAVMVTDAGVVGVGIIAWQTGQVSAGQPIGYGEETDAAAWVGLPAGTE